MVHEFSELVHVEHLKPRLIVLCSKCSVNVNYSHCSCCSLFLILTKHGGFSPSRGLGSAAGCWHSASL